MRLRLIPRVLDDMRVLVDVVGRDRHEIVGRRGELALKHDVAELGEARESGRLDVHALCFHVEILLGEEPAAHVPKVLVLQVKLVHALVAHDLAQAVLKPASTKPGTSDKSPLTGNTSNLALWISLLLASGGATLATTVASRKKKYNR